MLDLFRAAAECEWCGERNRGRLDPHHLFGRGVGGGTRLDVRINLVALCRQCHGKLHNGNIERAALLMVVAKREQMTVDAVEREYWRLWRKPK